MSWLLSDRNRPYIPAVGTNVLQTLKKHGFVPPSEIKQPKQPEKGHTNEVPRL